MKTLWNVEDVAEYLAVPVQSVCEMVSERCIPHLSIGEHLRFRRSDIDRWLDLLVVPCRSQALRPVFLSVDNPIVSLQHRDFPPEAPLSVPPAIPQVLAPTSRPLSPALSQAAKKSPVVFDELPPPAEKVQVIGRYTVRVRYQQIDPADQERRRRRVAEIFAKSLLRMKKEGGG
jgi:excisionase family DNA binding protein